MYLPQACIAQHLIPKIIQAFTAGKPAAGGNHHQIMRLQFLGLADKFVVNRARAGLCAAIFHLIRRVADNHVKFHIVPNLFGVFGVDKFVGVVFRFAASVVFFFVCAAIFALMIFCPFVLRFAVEADMAV